MTEDTDALTAAPDGRSTRWDDHRAQRRDQLVASAIELIAEGEDLAVAGICARARIPRSVVYRVFRDRDDLDEQIRARIVELLMEVLAPTLAPHGTIREAIGGAVTTYVEWVRQNPQLHLFLGTGSPRRRSTGSRVVTGTKTAIAVQLQSMLESALAGAGGDPSAAESVAFGLVGLVDSTVNRWVNNPRPGLSAEALSQFLATSIWSVLQPAAESAGVTITPETRVNDLLA